MYTKSSWLLRNDVRTTDWRVNPQSRTSHRSSGRLAQGRTAPYREPMGPVHKLLSELDALGPLAPALLSLWAAAPRAIRLARTAAKDAAASEQLGQLTQEAVQQAAAATTILWENDELLMKAGAQLRAALESTGADPRVRAALVRLKDKAMSLWDVQVERLVEGALLEERGDLADTFKVVETVLDGLLRRALR